MERFALAVIIALYTWSFDNVEGELKPQARTAIQQGVAGGLRALADRSDLLVGAAVAARPLRDDPGYRQVLAREYNTLVAENALKFGRVHPQPHRFDFGDADRILTFAHANGMCVRGHTLVWHRHLPPWIEDREWTRDALIGELRRHIRVVVGRYRGRIHYWDVVNEALSDVWGLRRSVWLDTIGPEYVALAFRFAHEADPHALLFYNDYGTEDLAEKSDRMYALVADLLDRGVPIHGVGLQSHLVSGIPSRAALEGNIRRLGQLGLEVHLTEVDVGVAQPVTQDRLRNQAILYQRLMDACLAARSCGAFVTWGFTDAHSWIPKHYPGLAAALPFDADLAPKLSYGALAASLLSSPRARPNAEAARGTANSSGDARRCGKRVDPRERRAVG